MKKILIATHGNAAQGIKDSLEMLTGITENVFTINAYTKENILLDEIKKFFDQVSLEDKVIVFTDIGGGSVNQAMIPFSKESNVFVITGFNIPLILELALESRDITNEIIASKIDISQKQMFKVEGLNDYIENEDDFFEGGL